MTRSILLMSAMLFALSPIFSQSSSTENVKSHDPYLGINYIICLQGTYPSRSGSGASEYALIGEIKMFASNFAPSGWALCEGQLLPISQNEALFSLLGTTYGGDGRTTFALPDLRGRVPLQQGTGPGLDPIKLGQKGGS